MTEKTDLSENSQLPAEHSLSDSLRELASAHLEIEEINADRADLSAKLEETTKRLAILEDVLQPRLKSILTLRPLLFVLQQRNARKREHQKSKTEKFSDAAVTPVASHSLSPTIAKGKRDWSGLGIALFAHTRTNCFQNTLESLARQDALHNTHIFIDGDQGKPALRKKIDEVYNIASKYQVKNIHRQRSAYGFRKMMLLSGEFMRQNYSRILFLEDDCFPTSNAIEQFSNELDEIEDKDHIFSVYGHPFMVGSEGEDFGRFQSWGWATTSKKLAPIWAELKQCYLMPEPEYLTFVNDKLSPEITNKIDVTPGRQPTETLRKFFAWDETVCLITALHGLSHKRTENRLIYNCGAGLNSTHFEHLQLFRKPPFNMIDEGEVWDFFDDSKAD